uniref:Cytochrome c oxidase subunit 2 n=1 Tax=Scirtidae sp. GENSP02 TaxID=1205581 RepID=A0A0S2MN18_9COLE|nr:cytochrome c oxidase subunit 2 [Scirtidae sp. GENSP02]
MATWSNLNLQDSASPLMEQLTFFHDHTLLILMMITTLVGYLMLTLFFNKFNNRYLLEGHNMEVIWTVLPAITLIFIALPSLRLLYLLDEINNPMITLKTIGHQWYWSYEYSDFSQMEFDSYMIPTNELSIEKFRLLDVDNRIILPMNTQIRLMVSAADVLHSWTIPSLGVKIDATPGRLNQTSFFLNRPGLFFGQCSEICHLIESVNTNSFIKWMINY